MVNSEQKLKGDRKCRLVNFGGIKTNLLQQSTQFRLKVLFEFTYGYILRRFRIKLTSIHALVVLKVIL
jgi:hypothetical protein